MEVGGLFWVEIYSGVSPLDKLSKSSLFFYDSFCLYFFKDKWAVVKCSWAVKRRGSRVAEIAEEFLLPQLLIY
jgi:hypothetical protein